MTEVDHARFEQLLVGAQERNAQVLDAAARRATQIALEDPPVTNIGRAVALPNQATSLGLGHKMAWRAAELITKQRNPLTRSPALQPVLDAVRRALSELAGRQLTFNELDFTINFSAMSADHRSFSVRAHGPITAQLLLEEFVDPETLDQTWQVSHNVPGRGQQLDVSRAGLQMVVERITPAIARPVQPEDADIVSDRSRSIEFLKEEE